MFGNQGWTNGGSMLGMGVGSGIGMSSGGAGHLGATFPSRGSTAFTGPTVGRSPGLARPAAFTEGKLFLGGLDSTTTKESLLSYCSQWGDINDAVVMEGRGFGFITFDDPANAQAFLEQRSHTIDGKSVEAKAAVPKGVGSGSNLTKKLFVGGTGELTDDDFREYFSHFGDIQDAVIVRKQDGTSRGFGFVTFADEMSVEKCLVIQHELKGRKVDLRRAVPREQMATQQVFGIGSSLTGIRPGYGMGFGMGGTGGLAELSVPAYGMSSYGMGMGSPMASPMGSMGGSMGAAGSMGSMGSMGAMGSLSPMASSMGYPTTYTRARGVGGANRFRPY